MQLLNPTNCGLVLYKIQADYSMHASPAGGDSASLHYLLPHPAAELSSISHASQQYVA